MGLLSEGSPLNWEETKKLSNHVRKHGVIQFINLYKRLRDRQGDVLKWGDEVYIESKFNMIYNRYIGNDNMIIIITIICVIIFPEKLQHC